MTRPRREHLPTSPAAQSHGRPEPASPRGSYARRVRRRMLEGLLVALLSSIVVPATPGGAQVAEQEVVALVIEGTGFGHGRGMSQWGAYGRAVNGAPVVDDDPQRLLRRHDARLGGDVVADPGPPPRPRRRRHRRGDLDEQGGDGGAPDDRLRRVASEGDGDGEPLRHLGAIDGRLPGSDDHGLDTHRRQRRRSGHVHDDRRTSDGSRRQRARPVRQRRLGHPLPGADPADPRQRRQPPSGQRRPRRELPPRRRAARGVDELGQRRRRCRDQRAAGPGGGGALVRPGAEPLRQLRRLRHDVRHPDLPGLRRRRPALQRRRRRRPAVAPARAATPRSSAPTRTGRSPTRRAVSGVRRAAPSCRPSSRRRTGRAPPAARSRRSTTRSTTCRRTPTTAGHESSTATSSPPPTGSAR